MRDFLRFVFLILLVLCVIFVGVAYYLIHFARPPAPAQEGGAAAPVEVTFEVQPGESTAVIGRHLAEHGLIQAWILPADKMFQIWAWVRRMDGRLEAGRYVLRSDMTMDEILETLTHAPRVEEVSFTILEGLRLEEIAASLEEQGIVSAEEFMAALKQPYDYAFLADRPQGASLEGYIFPDTYTVPRVYTATQIVDFILQNFDQKLSPTLREEAQARGTTIFQVVTLASIVEREAVLDAERPIIASVYMNRIGKGMPLEADPTVQYGVGYSKSQGTWWPVLYFDELGVSSLAEVDNPYNTYRYPGLPPGPICSPGLASLVAVVEPAQTQYLYFVAKGDGSGEHAFARTLEEHNANISRYQH